MYGYNKYKYKVMINHIQFKYAKRTELPLNLIEDERAIDIYNNSNYAIYQDKDDVYYLGLDYGARIDPFTYGTIKDIEDYLIDDYLLIEEEEEDDD